MKKKTEAENSSRTKSGLFGKIFKKEEKKTPAVQNKQISRKPKQERFFEICTDTNGRIVNCIKSEDGRLITAEGSFFSGIMKKVSTSGNKIEIKYANGFKAEESNGSDTKVYNENSTVLMNKNKEVISEISVNDSVVNSDCKSIVYYDEDIKFARIDFNDGISPSFAGLEIRQDGIVGGISQTGGKWHIYFSNSGEDIESRHSDCCRLYNQVKNILKELRENVSLSEKNPIDTIEEQIDSIYKENIKFPSGK